MKQSERSKQWLEDALLQLMETKRFTDITIQNITDKAGVSRLTFYRNFESKEAILQQHYNDVFKEYLGSLDSMETVDLETAIEQCYAFWRRCADQKNRMARNNLSTLMFQPLDQYLQVVLERVGLDGQYSEVQKRFIAGGLSCSLMDWIAEDKGVSPEQMAKEIMALIAPRQKQAAKERFTQPIYNTK